MSSTATFEEKDGRVGSGARSGSAFPAARALMLTVIAVLALVTAGAVGYAIAGPQAPADDSPEAGFARDMQVHHGQAVQMAFQIRDKTDDPTLRALAYDIITSQQQQIGQMYGWLARWGLPQAPDGPPMTWMRGTGDMTGTGMGQRDMPMDGGRMPGMASAADLQRLRSATGREAEVLFLRLMTAHHRGGIAMASAVLAMTDRPEVRTLARTIVSAQRAEIEQMRQLLRDRGARA